MKQLVIGLPEWMCDVVHTEAKENQISKSEVIRRLLTPVIPKKKTDEP